MRALSQDSFIDAPWHLAVCRPNQGHIAFRNLAKAGIDVFMPRHRTSRRWRGRLIESLQPVFGGYLFFSSDPTAPRWHQVATTPGIGSLVKLGGRPAQVPSNIVTNLMMRCDSDGCLIPSADFQAGETVQLTCGPFAGFIATIEKVTPERRIHLLLDMLGRATSLTVPDTMVAR
tara:strand:- start:115 stop:636 length:522 start_codon:yes stop_codon:yes gene_type:complete